MTQRVSLEYTTVKGKNVLVVLESKAKALATLKRLKKMGIVKTYAQGRKTRSLILTVHYCPICKKIMPVSGKNVVCVLNPISPQSLMAHRSCCEREKVSYRLYDPTNKGHENTVVHPK